MKRLHIGYGMCCATFSSEEEARGAAGRSRSAIDRLEKKS